MANASTAAAAHEREMASLSAEIVERYEEVTLLYRVAECLGSAIGEAEITELVLRDAAHVLGARAGEIWLRESKRLVVRASIPVASSGDHEAQPDEGMRAAMEQQTPWTREASEGVEAAVAVPLGVQEGRAIGALCLRGRSSGRSYRSPDVKLLKALAALTSAFICNHRLAAEARRAERRRREDEIARQIHRGLLPSDDPDFSGLDIAGFCRSAENIGGDYYGYIPLPDGSLGVAMADISGHGVGAALYMAAAKGALQAEARRALAPSDLLLRVNETLVEDFSRSDVFATAFFARFYRRGQRFEFSNAGHNPAVLLRRDGSMELLRRGGSALGVLADMTYEEGSRPFASGDLLLLYTDGLVEARNAAREFYGLDRLIAAARRHSGLPARQLREKILEDLATHLGDRPLQDDVTLVLVRGSATVVGR